jgi:hypothetical protein
VRVHARQRDDVERRGHVERRGDLEPEGDSCRPPAAGPPTPCPTREEQSEVETKNAGESTVAAVPAGLSDRSRALWSSITRDWPLELHELAILAEALRALDRADEARATIESEGITFADRFGQPREHPAVDVERKSRSQFKDIMRALDLKTEAD